MEVSGELHAPAALLENDWIGGCVGPRVTLHFVEKRQNPTPVVELVA